MLVETDHGALAVLLQNVATRKEGFRLILLKYQQRIYYFLRRIGFSHEEADEQIQEIFIEFWRSISLLQKTEASPLLLYRIAANLGLKNLSEKPQRKVNVSPEQRGAVYRRKRTAGDVVGFIKTNRKPKDHFYPEATGSIQLFRYCIDNTYVNPRSEKGFR
ncbi:hypothetical protein GWR56_06775 [Mucilaginibacter sp. 14171R-50]|uniref:RNA polymerase sigma factor n=1 Tax=Mucilaginibacter sp. 14171R-50 TaxID=2703789 RepID=UPI00138B3D85|nr:sigma factor [Mucilaginibacter sp. 14171R-50]QHS55258.1 hypothetical protein GWR56_06775 [Mucilaginibacter sp. 14171R-50]